MIQRLRRPLLTLSSRTRQERHRGAAAAAGGGSRAPCDAGSNPKAPTASGAQSWLGWCGVKVCTCARVCMCI